MIKVSVILPVYNMENYLENCLESLICQDLESKEIICINDGSTDNSLKIINAYSEKNSFIKVINQENSGVGKSRNLGIKMANGEFVAFVDPDDWYPEKDILKFLYNKALVEKASICGGSFSSYYFGNIKTEYDNGYTFHEDGRIKFKDYQWDYGYHRFIYKREMLIANNIYFPEYSRYQDPPFFVRAMLQAEEFYAVKKITYRYRVGHQHINWTVTKTRDLLKGLIDNLELSREYGLSKLHYNTVCRINKDFYQPIINNLDNQEIRNLVIRINECIDLNLIRAEGELIQLPIV